MSQATYTTQSRDPVSPFALAVAIDAYLLGTGPADERDIALEAALLEQGVLSPDDAIELLQTIHDGPEIRGVCVLLEGRTTMLAVHRSGHVHEVSLD